MKYSIAIAALLAACGSAQMQILPVDPEPKPMPKPMPIKHTCPKDGQIFGKCKAFKGLECKGEPIYGRDADGHLADRMNHLVNPYLDKCGKGQFTEMFGVESAQMWCSADPPELKVAFYEHGDCHDQKPNHVHIVREGECQPFPKQEVSMICKAAPAYQPKPTPMPEPKPDPKPYKGSCDGLNLVACVQFTDPKCTRMAPNTDKSYAQQLAKKMMKAFDPYLDKCGSKGDMLDVLKVESAYIKCYKDSMFVNLWKDKDHCDGKPNYTIEMSDGKCEKVVGLDQNYIKCWHRPQKMD